MKVEASRNAVVGETKSGITQIAKYKTFAGLRRLECREDASKWINGSDS